MTKIEDTKESATRVAITGRHLQAVLDIRAKREKETGRPISLTAVVGAAVLGFRERYIKEESA